MSAVGMISRTLWKAQPLKGGVRQFETSAPSALTLRSFSSSVIGHQSLPPRSARAVHVDRTVARRQPFKFPTLKKKPSCPRWRFSPFEAEGPELCIVARVASSMLLWAVE